MFQKFYINKQSGTYSEAIEAYGVAKFILELAEKRLNIKHFSLTIHDEFSHFEIVLSQPILEDQLDELKYFIPLPFIKKESKQAISTDIPSDKLLDYPQQKDIQEQYKIRYDSIEKNKKLTQDERRVAKKILGEEKKGEFGNRIKSEYDVMREIISKPYDSYLKLFDNFHKNQDNFPALTKEILYYYTAASTTLPKRIFKLILEKPNALQLYNPNQSKGLNRAKADSTKMDSVESNWITESMKILGSLSFMSCQFIKIGSTYDMKIYVPSFHSINLEKARSVTQSFKSALKSLSPIRLDIINILSFSEGFIKQTPQYNFGKLKNTLKGFYTTYQKSLGNARGITNISFIQTPDFIIYTTKEEADEWIEILDQQRKTIQSIEENGDAIQGLEAYRSFLGSNGESALRYFSKFSFWYSGYLMQQLTKNNRFIRTFKVEHLNKFYQNMEPTLSEIIENEGFKAIALAIRKSTVSLQYTPKEQRHFEIRYGLAQQLQNKAKSKNDLATFIGEFIGIYNAETGRYAEKNKGKAPRTNVKDMELEKFYKLLDTTSPRLIGALLTSYGFALHAKDKEDAPAQEEQELNNEEI